MDRAITIPSLPPPPSSVSNWICCNVYHDRDEFQRVLHGLELSNVQKQIILSRYIHILDHLQKRVRAYSRVFFIGHVIITVGSLFVPALLSIQNSSTLSSMNFSNNIYWATFIISLLVTTSNGILTLFKIDKKYYFLNTTLERLRTEGWQYLGLTGRYSKYPPNEDTPPTHQNQFVYFTNQIEKIKMKQIEEEYYKSDEISQTPQQKNTLTNTTGQPNDLYPPSLSQPIQSMVQHVPEPVKDAISALILRSYPLASASAPSAPTSTSETVPIASASESVSDPKYVHE